MSSNAPDVPRPAARRRGRPPRIDRGQIVDAALALGMEDASMRAVAERLGVTDAALYHHFPSRDALQEAMADALAHQFELPEPVDAWRDWAKAFALRLRADLLDHPGLAAVFSRTGPAMPGALRIVEGFVTTLVASGIDVYTAARAYSLVTSYLIAVVIRQESLERRGGTERMAPAFAQTVEAAGGLSPILGEVARTWLEASWDGEFEYGIDRILDGLALHVRVGSGKETA